MITNVILILYNSSINNKLILRHHIACFCCILPTQNNSKGLQRCFESQWFVHEWIIRLNDSVQSKWFGSVAMVWFSLSHSVQSQWFGSISVIRFSHNDLLINSYVLPPAGGLISHLKSVYIFFIILNISIQCFMFKMSKNDAFVTG